MKIPVTRTGPTAIAGAISSRVYRCAVVALLLALGAGYQISSAGEPSGTTAASRGTSHADDRPAAHADSTARHALLTALLAEHVQQGRVDYAALQNDPDLDAYLAQLAATDPDTMADRDDQLALWLNAYNAYTLKVVVDNYPIDSINDLHTGGVVIGHILNKTVWDRKFVVVGGRTLSLDEVEHGIVRKQFDDARIHFALVCAARSCPRLRAEAYEGYRLDAQLEDQGRIFFAEPLKNYFRPESRSAHLSKILDWYGDDFGASDEEILLYVARFLPDDLAAALRSAPDSWRIEYTPYYWQLNGL